MASPCLAESNEATYHPLSVGNDVANIVFSPDARKMAVIHFSMDDDPYPAIIRSSLQVFAVDNPGAQGKLLYDVEKPGGFITSAAWAGDTWRCRIPGRRLWIGPA